MDHRIALIILNMLPGIGPGRKRLLSAFFGSAEAALSASVDDLCRIHGIGSKLAPVIHNWESYCNIEEELRMASQAGVQIITDEDPWYPPLLREIHDAPICLYVRGSLDLLKDSESSIAIVGSRNSTVYGERMARSLAASASMAGWPVVSGLARGIDTAAHDETLRSGGRTIAVIGSGLSCIYPQENINLALAITQYGGAVISEFPMFYRPDKRSFPMRNRIISGISRGTIVVEAGYKSGSLITAAQAIEQNRTVFAVPGQADKPFSNGCHALIKDGAVLTESFQDVVNEFTGLPGLLAPPKESQANPPPKPDIGKLNLSGLELKLWNMIHSGEHDIDMIIDKSGEEASCVSAALLTLELKRLIKQYPGRRVEASI